MEKESEDFNHYQVIQDSFFKIFQELFAQYKKLGSENGSQEDNAKMEFLENTLKKALEKSNDIKERISNLNIIGNSVLTFKDNHSDNVELNKDIENLKNEHSQQNGENPDIRKSNYIEDANPEDSNSKDKEDQLREFSLERKRNDSELYSPIYRISEYPTDLTHGFIRLTNDEADFKKVIENMTPHHVSNKKETSPSLQAVVETPRGHDAKERNTDLLKKQSEVIPQQRFLVNNKKTNVNGFVRIVKKEVEPEKYENSEVKNSLEAKSILSKTKKDETLSKNNTSEVKNSIDAKSIKSKPTQKETIVKNEPVVIQNDHKESVVLANKELNAKTVTELLKTSNEMQMKNNRYGSNNPHIEQLKKEGKIKHEITPNYKVLSSQKIEPGIDSYRHYLSQYGKKAKTFTTSKNRDDKINDTLDMFEYCSIDDDLDTEIINIHKEFTRDFEDSDSPNDQEKNDAGEIDNNDKLLTLRQLHDLIAEFYRDKAAFDIKSTSLKNPRMSPELFLYDFLKKKYGLQELVMHWAYVIVESVNFHASRDSEVSLFKCVCLKDP